MGNKMMIQAHREKLRLEKVNYWKPILTAWQESGLSVKEYCANHQLNLYRFKYWQYQLLPETKNNSKLRTTAQIAFTPIVIEPKKTTAPVELQTPQGYCLKLTSDFDEGTLLKLLTLLGRCL
jgi:transposase